MKKDGGILTGWQFHTMTDDMEAARRIRPDLDFTTDKIYKMSATVVKDNLGRWNPGDHMRSSLVVSIDMENMIVETENTLYHLEGEPGDVLPDIGAAINNIYY